MAIVGTSPATYEVPIIQCDLRHEETIIQIADAIDYLNEVIDDVFNRIDNKIAKNKTKLHDLQRRCELAKAKVNKLAGSKKSTKVLSSAKYPASDVQQNYESVFSMAEAIPFKQSEIKIKSKHRHPDVSELQDKLQFFHVKASNKLLKRNMEIAPEEGLGSLPYDLDSISSLLLFNTSENPYKRYVMLDPLGAAGKSRHNLDEDDRHMEAAPFSISQREQLEHFSGLNYSYAPPLGDVPRMDMPPDLPDLPGVADDLRYSMDSEPAIAPSVSTTPAMPELPSLLLETPVSPPSPPEPSTLPPPDPLPTLPPLPPPSPSMPSLAPPPPPPPPPPIQAMPSVSIPEKPTPQAPPVNVDGDARANLMEAIRNAGGSKKLRSAKDRKIEAKKKKNEEKQSGVVNNAGGGDLMADLHAKLAMRRKGISGAKADAPVTGVMGRVSAMIPPPEADTLTPATTDGNDEDWD